MNCLVLFALLSWSQAQELTVSPLSELNFGVLVQGDPEKTIPSGSSETSANASFRLTGAPGASYSVILPDSIQILNGGNEPGRTLDVRNFSSFPSGSSGVLTLGGESFVYVGATISSVLATQVVGIYRGSFPITIVY